MQREEMCNCYYDRSLCSCVRTSYKDWKFGTQTLHGQFFSSTDLFNGLHTKAINCCDIVRPNQKGIPGDFGRKLTQKWGDIKSKVRMTLQLCHGGQTKHEHIDKYASSSSRR
jgi:hypothetical protein